MKSAASCVWSDSAPAGPLEEIVLDRLGRIAGWRAEDFSWNIAQPLLRRLNVHAGAMHVTLDRTALRGGSRDGHQDLDRLRARLLDDETLASSDADAVTVILPIRMKIRGGRTWITTPDGRDAIARTRLDASLINGLRAGHGIANQHGLHGNGAANSAPPNPYDRKVCLLAFLAPDIQQAILDGRQPASLNLERLIHEQIPLAWADQRTVFGF